MKLVKLLVERLDLMPDLIPFSQSPEINRLKHLLWPLVELRVHRRQGWVTDSLG